MRSTVYDSTPSSLAQLSALVVSQNNILQKSKGDGGSLTGMEEVVEIHHEKNSLCELINTQFAILQSDFDAGRINYVRFQEHLKAYQNFFQTDITAVEIAALKVEPILEAINKYL
jgi:hypothetical protein